MMNVSSWSIRNPIPAILLFLLLTLAGLMGFRAMKVQNMPDIDLPMVIVSASLPGAAPAAGSAAAPAQPAATGPLRSVVGIEIEGMGYQDRIKSEAVGKYRDQLRESKWFSEQTEIIWQPPARSDASTLEFKILAVLKEPQAL